MMSLKDAAETLARYIKMATGPLNNDCEGEIQAAIDAFAAADKEIAGLNAAAGKAAIHNLMTGVGQP
jgi:3-deoxy-D-arabino-heptulosonate 7-phosphate (DAHP) synthase